MSYQPKVMGNKPKLFGLKTILSFGKYKDRSVQEVLAFDSGYINWCVYKEIFDITAEVADAIEECSQDYIPSDFPNERSLDGYSREYYERRYAEACSYDGLSAKKVDGCWIPDNE